MGGWFKLMLSFTLQLWLLYPSGRLKAKKLFHTLTRGRKQCVFLIRGSSWQRAVLSPVSNKSQVGGDFQSSWSIQQHCLWPLLLIAVEQNGLAVQTTPPPPLPHPLMVSALRRLSVFQGRDGLRKTEATLWWEEREGMRKRCMDRWVWSGSSQPWWRLMGGWGDKSWEGGSEGVFVRGGTCWKAGIIGERVDGKANQDRADMMSTAQLRNGGEQGENQRATVINGKGKLEEGWIWWWWGDSPVFVVRREEEQVVIPGACMSTSLVHHLCLQKLIAAQSSPLHFIMSSTITPPAIPHGHTGS